MPKPLLKTPSFPHLPSPSAPVRLSSMFSSVAVSLVEKLLCFYQRFLSAVLTQLLGSGCRFEPTCSEYAKQAVRRFGVLRGAQLSIFRLCRCHPFHPGGYDPPPEKEFLST